MGNARGTWPATPVSPDYPAKESFSPSETRRGFFLLPMFADAGAETTHFSDLPVDAEPCEDGEGEALDIEATFKRKLMGLRRMPRRERAATLQAAREWRRSALNGLREKRSILRYARHMLRRLRMLVL